MSKRFRHERLERLICALAALLLIFALYAAMCGVSGVKPGAYPYPSYRLQAQAWLRGEIPLDRNYEYLELAVYGGKYYVSFPPVPAIPMVLWTLIWGDDVPGGLFQKLYVAAACLVILSMLLRPRRDADAPLRLDGENEALRRCANAAAWAALFCFGSALLPISLVGAVWYEAQILAFLFCVGAVAAMDRNRPTLSCLLYALAVGCRPFSVCLGPALLALYLMDTRKQPARRRAGRLVPGLAVAACYGVYNYVRFGNIFEFGHSYLPEYTREGAPKFALSYLAENWRTLFFGSPFVLRDGQVGFQSFGFSMFLSNPILICNGVWIVRDIARRSFTREKRVVAWMLALNTLLLLTHKGLGGQHFGMRYALELVPLSLVYLRLCPERARMTRWEAALLGFGLTFNFIGGCMVHI